jgi:hypothetical protein
MRTSNGSSQEIDKKLLYGQFIKGLEDDRKLGLKAAYKALDIPEDMDIKVKKTGIGALGAIGIALASGLAPAGLGMAMLWNQAKPIAEKIIEKPGQILKGDANVEVEDVIVRPPK